MAVVFIAETSSYDLLIPKISTDEQSPNLLNQQVSCHSRSAISILTRTKMNYRCGNILRLANI